MHSGSTNLIRSFNLVAEATCTYLPILTTFTFLFSLQHELFSLQLLSLPSEERSWLNRLLVLHNTCLGRLIYNDAIALQRYDNQYSFLL